MNEEEQAKKLSDAIDAILKGGEPELDLDDDDLIELLRIARLRHRAGEALADVGLAYQELLRRVLQARMVARQIEQETEGDNPAPEAQEPFDFGASDLPDPLDIDRGKLLNFLDFYPGASHRPATGVAVDTRPDMITPAPTSTPASDAQQVVPLRRRQERGSEKARAHALDAILEEARATGKLDHSLQDPELAELLEVAKLRQCVGHSLAAAGSPYKRRLWTALRLRLAAVLRRQSYRREARSPIAAVGEWGWQKAAAAAAVLALLIGALGPLPATGLAQHPISNFFNFVSERTGVEEVDGPPPTQVPTWAPKQAITAPEVQARLGLAVAEPSYVPDGFALASGMYYTESYTSPEQGMFVLTYTIGGVDSASVPIGDPILSIYQEQATEDSVAVQTGQAEDVTLADSVPATYTEGIWVSGSDGSVQWANDDAERLVFEDGDIRAIIVFRGVENVKDELVRIAESMLQP